MSADALAREVRRLVDRTTHWTPSRWAASGVSGVGSRTDIVYTLVQELADRGAVAEGEPRRPVPRLPHASALVDQVRVLSADLLAAQPPEPDLAAAAETVAAANRAL